MTVDKILPTLTKTHNKRAYHSHHTSSKWIQKNARNLRWISFSVALQKKAEILLSVFVWCVDACAWHYHYFPTRQAHNTLHKHTA